MSFFKLVLNEIMELGARSMVPRPWRCGSAFSKFTIWRLPTVAVTFCIRAEAVWFHKVGDFYWQLNLEPAPPGFISHLIPGDLQLHRLVSVVSACLRRSPVDTVPLLEEDDVDLGGQHSAGPPGSLSSDSLLPFSSPFSSFTSLHSLETQAVRLQVVFLKRCSKILFL